MSWLKGLWAILPKKLLYAIVAALLAGLRRAHPDWPIPDDATILGVATLLIGGHTVTDAVSLYTGRQPSRVTPDTGLRVPVPPVR